MNLTVKEALPAFYRQYQLQPDGGAQESSVKVELVKGFSLYIPNVEARKKVVLKHDMHHVLTGYNAVMKGETEISAWELSTGCSHNWVAFTINTYGMMMGVLFNLPGIWRAWVRGRHTRNLYTSSYRDEELLTKTVDELRIELGLHESPPASAKASAGWSAHPNLMGSFLSFSGFLVFGAIFSVASLVLLPATLLYSLYIILKKGEQS